MGRCLSDEELLEGLRHMMTLRAFDARMQMAQRQGKTSFYMQHMGEEAVSCAFRKALRAGRHELPDLPAGGPADRRGYPMVDMMCQIYSNERDPLKGRQLPVMYSSKEHGFFSHLRQSRDAVHAGGRLGDGLGDQERHEDRRGLDRRRLDGGVATFTRRWCSPRPTRRRSILNIVNNQWAISTFQGIARGGSGTFAARGLGFGIPALRVDGNDYLAVHAVAQWAASGRGAISGRRSIEYVTYRVGAHSTSDDPSAYRPKTNPTPGRSAIRSIRLKNHLILRGVWSEERHKQAEAEMLDTVIAAQKEAESYGTLHAGGKPSARDMFEGVYAEMPPHLRRQRQQAGV